MWCRCHFAEHPSCFIYSDPCFFSHTQMHKQIKFWNEWIGNCKLPLGVSVNGCLFFMWPCIKQTRSRHGAWMNEWLNEWIQSIHIQVQEVSNRWASILMVLPYKFEKANSGANKFPSALWCQTSRSSWTDKMWVFLWRHYRSVFGSILHY